MTFILPPGAEILTDPSQISKYRILGQIGKTSAPGSYLYGVRKDTESRDLPGQSEPQPPQPQQPEQPNQSEQFDRNQIFQATVLAMLKAAQGAGDEDLQAKRNAIIQARFNVSRETTPEELRILSPQAQAGIRNLSTAGLEEQLGGVSAALKGRQEQRTAQAQIGSELLKYLAPPEEKHSPAYIEWQDAVGAGFKGSFNDYQTLDANRKERIAKAGASTTVVNPVTGLTQQQTEQLSTVNNISNVLNSPNFNTTFGLQSIARRNLPGSPEYTLANQVNQIIEELALAARGKLKGQGSVSNFEAQMLRSAQTALKINTNPDDARKELIKVRGALITSSGGTAFVKVSGQNKPPKFGPLDSNGITSAIQQGFRVEYQ